jgi:phasin family protein
MSEVSNQIEKVVDASVEAAAKVAAPIEAATESVSKNLTKATKSAAKPRAKAVPKARAKAATKVAVAAKPVVAISAQKPTRKSSVKAETSIVRRKYVRKTVAAVKTVTAPVNKGTKTMTDTNMFFAMPTLPSADKLQSLFGDVSVKGQDAVKKSQAFAEQLTEAAKANIEAVVESSKIATAGARDLGTEIVATTKSGVEHAQNAIKSLTQVKSPTEFFQLQSDLMRASFDRMVADGSKLTEQMVKLTGEAVQPLSNRASVNAEKFSELTS